MTEAVFPFTLRAYDNGDFAQSPMDFREVYLAKRNPDVTWFAYDVIVKSYVDVTFIVYGMHGAHGGIGKFLYSFDAVVDTSVTQKPVERRLNALATKRFDEEQRAAEEATINRYVEELRETL